MARKVAITAAMYNVVAEGVRRIASDTMRRDVADHFAAYFASRSPAFDAQAWFVATGGLVNRQPAKDRA